MANFPATSLSRSVGDYLKAIWTVGGDEGVSTSALAAELQISAASVSAMLAKLQEVELVTYRRYYGAELTREGRLEALRLIRRHRLLETFLIDYLGYTWDEVHAEAEAIEHVISERFTERLAAKLAHPTHDPHGDPIPSADGSLPETPNIPLADVEVGDTLRVARLLTQDGASLSYLASLRIQPGARLKVEGREPHGGLVRVRVAGEPQAISKELATLIRGAVEKVEKEGREKNKEGGD
jgi:DtxR family Mn-dependent transcriptional regulator